MTRFFELSNPVISLFGLWLLLLMVCGITETVFSFTLKRPAYALFSLPVLILSFFGWQITFDLYSFGMGGETHAMSRAAGFCPWLLWVFVLLLLTLAGTACLVLNHRHAKRRVTPFAIKHCADRMACGICYWRDNGHVIFSNECMDRLCVAFTGRALMNGNVFREAVPEGIRREGKTIWNFIYRDLEFEGALLHEAIAWDVTEIRSKTESLRQENEGLTRLNREMIAHGMTIDDTVRRRELLQAKINIHDEMNRLMLSTVAVDAENTEELDRIFRLWRKNALLLCMEADEKLDDRAIEQSSESLARALGIGLVWHDKPPEKLSAEQRELFRFALREAITNAVKHASATLMEVSFEEDDSSVFCRFQNDGTVPSGKVLFTGGLANLEVMARERNASISVDTGHRFVLTLCISKSC